MGHVRYEIRKPVISMLKAQGELDGWHYAYLTLDVTNAGRSTYDVTNASRFTIRV